MKLNRSKEWWIRMAEAEGDAIIGAGVPTRVDKLEEALRRLTFMARTSGGTAGRDEGLCAACDAAEALLLANPTEEEREKQDAIERVILRRLHEKRIEGYTLEMAQEIAAIPSTAQTKGEG